MKARTQILISLILIFYINANSQDQKIYIPLKSEGTPPSYMTKSAYKKTKEKEVTTSPYRPRNERFAELEFYTSGNYAINELLVSGDVLYGEGIHDYLDKILIYILKSNNIDEKIDIHPVKSSVFNAFATEEAIIFINLGLLSQVRNEAELAYVICHELTHFLKKHSREGFLTEYKMENMKEYSSLSTYDKVLNKHSYSRAMEYQADSLGLEFYKNCGYDLKYAVSVFELMDENFKQFNEIEFNAEVNFFDYYESLNDQKLDTLSKIFVSDSVLNEELSTHPETTKRKMKIEKSISGNSAGKAFILTETEFNTVKKLADLESLRLALMENRFLEAFCMGQEIKKKYPEYKSFGNIQMIKSLIGLLQERLNYDSKKGNSIDQYKISSNSSFRPLLYYFMDAPVGVIVLEIEIFINEELKTNGDNVEIIALNNWFIEKVKSIAKKNNNVSCSLSEIKIETKTYDNVKKIFMDPYFINIDFRKVYKLDYVKTEKELIAIQKRMRGYLKQKDSYYIISSADKTQLTSEVLYEKEIITKRLKEIESTPKGEMSPFPNDYYVIKEVCDKYNTQNVSVTFAATAYYKVHSPLGAGLLFVFAPLGIYLLTAPNVRTFAEYQEFDLINGTISNKRYLEKNAKFSGSSLRYLYYPKN